MKKEAVTKLRKQEVIPAATSIALGQLVLPMMIASEAIKKGLLAFVQQLGMLAFREMLEGEADSRARPRRSPGRRASTRHPPQGDRRLAAGRVVSNYTASAANPNGSC